MTEYGLWPVQDALGSPHTGIHAFRHAAASELLDEGAPLTVVQRQLRHCDAKTTLQKYGHVVGDSQRRAVNTLTEKIERHAIELGQVLNWSQPQPKWFVCFSYGAGDGDRTHVRSLGSFYTAIVRRPLWKPR